MAVRTAERGRFAVVGEPIVALDLIDTVAPPGSPAADVSRLRWCANPACSMIFAAVNPRRS